MVESLITSPDFWRQSGKYESKMMMLKAFLAKLPRADKAPMLVWTTLEKAINGWCVEEYRVQSYFNETSQSGLRIDGLKDVWWFLGDGKNAITITPSQFGGSDTAVTITYRTQGGKPRRR